MIARQHRVRDRDGIAFYCSPAWADSEEFLNAASGILIGDDGRGRLFGDVQTEHVGPHVVADDVEAVLAANNFAEIDLGRENFPVEDTTGKNPPQGADDDGSDK